MAGMTAQERFVGTLTGQEVDRVPFIKCFGVSNQVLAPWLREYPNLDQYIDELLQFEGGYRGWQVTPAVNFGLCGDNPSRVISEDDRYIIRKDRAGTVTKTSKSGDYHAYTMEYPVKDENDWDRIKETYLKPDDPRRIPRDWDYYAELYAGRDYPLQLTYGGVYGFARKMMGDEALCFAFYDMPELVHDIIDTYNSICLSLWEKLCDKVHFDLIESWEDMASKTGSIISPATFDEFLAGAFRNIRSFADAHSIPIVLVDSDGNIDELAKIMYKNGVNAMFPFEVGAGCHPIQVLDELEHMGAVACLEKNACALGKEAVDQQMEFAAQLIRHGRCIPGPDHFVLENVSFDQYKYFMNRLREVILTVRPGD